MLNGHFWRWWLDGSGVSPKKLFECRPLFKWWERRHIHCVWASDGNNMITGWPSQMICYSNKIPLLSSFSSMHHFIILTHVCMASHVSCTMYACHQDGYYYLTWLDWWNGMHIVWSKKNTSKSCRRSVRIITTCYTYLGALLDTYFLFYGCKYTHSVR